MKPVTRATIKELEQKGYSAEEIWVEIIKQVDEWRKMEKMNAYFELLFLKQTMDDIVSQGYRYDEVLLRLGSFEKEFERNGISEQELDLAFENWIKQKE